MVSNLVLAQQGSKNIFDRPRAFFKRETKPQVTTCVKLCKWYYFNFIVFYLSNAWIWDSSSTQLYYICIFIYISPYVMFSHWVLMCSHSFISIPFRLVPVLISKSGGARDSIFEFLRLISEFRSIYIHWTIVNCHCIYVFFSKFYTVF